MSIAASELILNADGSVYHLALKPGEMAHKVIFVGDPDRVDKVSRHLDELTLKRQKREFCTITGRKEGTPISIISTGIGTDNIDIVLNEIDALFNIDLETREVKSQLTRLEILRLGTTGTVQADIPLDSLIMTRFALGADGLMTYYETMPSLAEAGLRQAWEAYIPYMHGGYPQELYLAAASDHFVGIARKRGIQQGITLTAKGFYGPQGRGLGRMMLRMPKLVDELAGFGYDGTRMTNIEMETAGILGMGQALGHSVGSMSVVLANRANGTFSSEPEKAVEELIEVGVDILLRGE